MEGRICVTRAEPESDAIGLPADLRSAPHLRSCALCSDRLNEIQGPPVGWLGSAGLRGERLPHLRVERSQLMWFGLLVRMPPGRLALEGFPDTSSWEETPGGDPDLA